MKQLKIVFQIALITALTNTFATAQNILSDGSSNYQSVSYNNNTSNNIDNFLAVTEPGKSKMNIELNKNITGSSTNGLEKKDQFSLLKKNRFVAKANFAQPKQLSNGNFSVSTKQGFSSIGNVAIKEASIVYNELGIMNVTMQLDKSKAKLFIDAHLQAYGSPNNENILDNYSWIVNGYVIEIVETGTNTTVTYQKATPKDNYLNEGVRSTLF